MKAKHLLFSGIFLSMGFAACTNEVEEFNAQSVGAEATELGEDFVIGVTNADFNADQATRAALEKVDGQWIASWQENDALGAAWFNKSTWKNGEYKAGSAREMYLGGEYSSNNEFVWIGENKFKSEANSMTGAYVLYWPYNEANTDGFSEIPVKPIASNKFDCNAVEKYVNENIFAANVVNFKTSGTQTPEFTIKQIPVLYAVSFYIDDENLLKLGNNVSIEHVLIEATKDGKPAINTEGIVQPQGKNFVVTDDQYKGDKPMTDIEFVGKEESRISRMVVKVENSNEDYEIRDLGKDNGTANFYFSMLPTEQFDKVSFKIVGKVDGKFVVFGKSQVNANFEDYSANVQKMTQSGQVVNLGVKLEYTSTEEGIYSVEQFIEYWNNGETSFEFQAPLILTDLSTYKGGADVNFALAEDKAVTFKGMPVTLPSISGAYSFESDVTINGNATLTGGTVNGTIDVTGDLTIDATALGSKALSIKGNATVGGKLTTRGNVTFSRPVAVTGDVTVETGKLKVGSKSTINGNVKLLSDRNGTTTFEASSATIKKNLTVNAGTEAKMSGTWSAANVTLSGTLSQTKASDKATIAKVTVKKGNDIYAAPELNITNGTIVKMASLAVNENAPVTIGAAVTEIGDITAAANVTFNGEVTKAGKVNATTGKVTFGSNVGTINDITAAADVAFNGNVTSAGNIVATTGKVTFAGEVTEKVENITAASEISFKENVNEVGNIGTEENHTTAKVTFEKNAKVGIIYADAEVFFGGAATTGAITTKAPVKFTGSATVLGNITADKAKVEFMDVAKLMYDAPEGDDSYYDLILKNEAEVVVAKDLIADEITVDDQYSKLSVGNSIVVNTKLTANGNVNAPVQAASTIEDLYIAPGVTVSFDGSAKTTINNLYVDKKGDYDGILIAPMSASIGIDIKNGTNLGTIKAHNNSNTTISGSFSQNGNIENKITVSQGAFLNVMKDVVKAITNNGTVNIEDGANVTTTALTNKANATLNVEGSVLLNNNASAVANITGGNVKLSAENFGTIIITNGSSFDANDKTINDLAYEWNAVTGAPQKDDANPLKNLQGLVTRVIMNGATVNALTEVTNITSLATIDVKNTWTLPVAAKAKALDFTNYVINVVDNATFTAPSTSYIKADEVKIQTGKQMTIDPNVKFVSGSSINVAKDASLKGDKGDATITNIY